MKVNVRTEGEKRKGSINNYQTIVLKDDYGTLVFHTEEDWPDWLEIHEHEGMDRIHMEVNDIHTIEDLIEFYNAETEGNYKFIGGNKWKDYDNWIASLKVVIDLDQIIED